MPGEEKSPALVPPSAGTESGIAESLYKELHRIAAIKMRFERPNHTLQPTALVNEAYMRLADQNESVWRDRARVLGLAAHIMRNILVDHARSRKADRRGAGAVQVTLGDDLLSSEGSVIDVLAVDAALAQLAQFDKRAEEVVEMHFFGGLTFEEIAVQLHLSARTVKRDWEMARAWLHDQLSTPNEH